MSRDTQYWRQRGDEARLAHEAVHRAFKDGVREQAPGRYDALLDVFRATTTAALPTTAPNFLQSLADGDNRIVDEAIAFLEADPWFFRSGYEKQNLIRHLKRIPLSAAQKERLARVVLAAVDDRDRVEFRHYCRLACAIWSDALDEEIAERMESSDPGIRRRAIWVAEAALSAGKA